MHLNEKIRVLVVDDSAVARRVITRALGSDPQIEIVGTAADAYEGRDKILELNPTVVTLDIEMPRMDGIRFLKILMRHHPLPVIIVSSLTQKGSAKVFEALEAGAVEALGKPMNASVLPEFEQQLVQHVKSAAAAQFRANNAPVVEHAVDRQARKPSHDRIIVIGASTGGIEALKELLPKLPEDLPPVCIVQHIPAYISGQFAKRLDELCALEVQEAEHGACLRSGLALVAPGGHHMVLRRNGSQLRVELEQTPPVNFQRPSVDVLFNSAASCAGARAIGVLLTGMGKDGAAGMRQLKEAGAVTIAQNEATSVVYGMPRAAVELGAVRHVLPLERIAATILRYASE